MTAIQFNSFFPVLSVFVVTILAGILLSWLEIKRKQKLLILRLIALLLAIISIACLVLNPIRNVQKSSDIILLTKGFNKEILDSLLKAHPASQVYQFTGAEAGNAIAAIDNYRDLDKIKGNLYLLGQGIPSYMLEYADTSALQFFPSSVSDGFIRVNTSKKYTANQPATIDGVFKSVRSSKIKLIGPGIAEDSLSLSAENAQSFSLTFTPKNAGLQVYNLIASDSSGKIMHSEQLPIEVQDQNRLSILIVADYPSAEIRFLKNFMGSQNHQVIVRYKISKDKYRTEFTNTSQRSINRLNETLLKSFDLVITDVSGFSSLTQIELQALSDAERFGLGVLTLLNTADLPKSLKNYLNINVAPVKADSAQLIIQKQRIKVPTTAIRIASDKKLQVIQQDAAGRLISGYRTNGLGKSGFQLLTNTYTLQLAGQKETYANLWSGVLETLARKDIKKYDLEFILPQPYYEDEPVDFKIIAAGEKPTVTLDSVEVPLAEDALIKNVWHGKIWAGQAGWHSLKIEQDSSQHNFFVSPVGAWNNLRAYNQQLTLRTLASPNTESVLQVTREQIPPIIFFVLFILAAGFLWLAPKL